MPDIFTKSSFEILILIAPVFSTGILALALLFRVHKRSISTFIIFIIIAIMSNAIKYGYIETALATLMLGQFFLLVRAMLKPSNDKVFYKPQEG